MSDALLLACALLACCAGLGWLALSLGAHWRQLHGALAAAPRTVIALRVLGTGALVVGLLLCLRADHPTMAVLVWTMLLTVAAFIVTFALALWPRLLVPLAWLVGGARDRAGARRSLSRPSAG